MRDIARLVAIALALASCGERVDPTARAQASASAPIVSVSPAASAAPTKPFSQAQAPLAAPTRVSWGVDRGSPDDPLHRRLFELYFDGNARGFRIVDASGNTVLVLPIAGSGIFDETTCLSSAKPSTMNATWAAIDDATYERVAANGASYRVVVETIGVPAVTLPLIDSGCRRP